MGLGITNNEMRYVDTLTTIIMPTRYQCVGNREGRDHHRSNSRGAPYPDFSLLPYFTCLCGFETGMATSNKFLLFYRNYS